MPVYGIPDSIQHVAIERSHSFRRLIRGVIGTSSTIRVRRNGESMTIARLWCGLVCVALLSCTSRWDNADEFVDRLQCGMTRADVVREAQRYRGTTVYEPGGGDLPDLVVKEGGTNVRCFFGPQGLRAVEVWWISEPAKMTTEPRKELCNPRRRGVRKQ